MTADDLPAAFDGLPAAWRAVLPGWTPQRCGEVVDRVRAVSAHRPIGPPDPFRALRLVAPRDVKVVVFGQDPYPKPDCADGLAFSAGRGKPPSLRRIFQVLAEDRPGWAPPAVWTLDAWARQGVLLLNPTLSVEIGVIGSHMSCGWQALTSRVVEVLCELPAPPVFMLWGSKARDFFSAARPEGVTVTALETRHPSNDMQRRFMAEGRHFLMTADRVDWWAIADPG